MIAVAQKRAAQIGRAAIDSRLWPGALILALGAAALLYQLGQTINHDTAWFLHATARFLDGGRLYVDIIELNPPLAFYLTVPPVAAARILGVTAVDAFVVYVFVLIAGSLAVSREILSPLPAGSQSCRRWTLAVALFALAVLPGAAFGQREHLIAILALPYLVLTAMRAADRAPSPRLALLAGLAAGIAFSIKPPFLVVAAILEIYLRVVRGRKIALFRAETLALGAVAALYAASIPVLTPEYIDFILPLTASVYGAYESAFANVIARLETVLLPIAIAALVATGGHVATSRLAQTFLIAGASYFALYVAQMKGWQYQLYPATAMLLLGAGAMLFAPAVPDARAMPGRMTAWRAASIPALLLLVLAIDLGARGSYVNPMTRTMLPLVRENAARGGLAVFSTNLSWGFPLANYAGADWASRFPTLWPLPGIIRGRADPRHDAAALDRVEQYMTDAVIEDLTRRPPAVVLVDVREKKHYFGGHAFDYLAFFGRDLRFQRIWRDYERVVAQPAFHVYVRRPAGGE
jgi:hypothetical protein